MNRDWLHVFVAGPGQGEGIAVALPGQGWLLVDGCSTAEGRFPLEEVLKRWGMGAGDGVEALVLTHPHEDHVEGIAELLETLTVKQVAVATGSTPGATLVASTQALRRGAAGGTTRNQLLAAKVIAAFEAIERWESTRPGGLLGLSDGQGLQVSTQVQVHARSPDAGGVSQFFQSPNLARRLRSGANHLSIVLEVCFGSLRLVLTGDLPYLDSKGGRAVPTGWDSVMQRHPQLGEHHGFKVPHHGSPEAMHPDWMKPGTVSPRAWLVTPYNSSGLPHLARMDGLPTLLQHQPEVLLTAPPVSKRLQADPGPGNQVRLVDLVARVANLKQGRSFLDGGTVIHPGSALEPLDPLWCIAFDSKGTVRGRWHGRAALAVSA
ncbi:MBL fold metallo-hydrolase [Myxococcus faecalis]|uniref:MBL fold metallo-hydrolase n=1 Tax=Myxococcus faecalis TaxID=3115646 RepID=UPI003CE81AFF